MAIDRPTMDLAARQGGVVTRAQLLDQGLTPSWINREIKAGRLTLIRRGVYRAVDMRAHLDLLRAARASLPNPVVSHESAAHLLRFPVLPRLVPTVTVDAGTTHTFPGVTVRRSRDLRLEHTVTVSGLRVTNVVRALVDLAAVLDEEQLDDIVGALASERRLRIPKLEELIASVRRRGKPGLTVLDGVLERRRTGGGVSPTVLERLGLEVLAKHGLSDPILQFAAPWDDRERIDAAYPPWRVGIEWDSAKWHSSPKSMANDRRRDRLATLAGWVILRYTWKDLTERPSQVAAEIRALISARS